MLCQDIKKIQHRKFVSFNLKNKDNILIRVSEKFYWQSSLVNLFWELNKYQHS